MESPVIKNHVREGHQSQTGSRFEKPEVVTKWREKPPPVRPSMEDLAILPLLVRS